MLLREARIKGDPVRGAKAIFKMGYGSSGDFMAIDIPESHRNRNDMRIAVRGKTKKEYAAKMADKLAKEVADAPRKDHWNRSKGGRHPELRQYMKSQKVRLMLKAMLEDYLGTAGYVLIDRKRNKVGTASIPLTDKQKKSARKKFADEIKKQSAKTDKAPGSYSTWAYSPEDVIERFLPNFDESFYFIVSDSKARTIRVPIDDDNSFMHSRTSRDRDIVYTFPERSPQMNIRNIRNVVKTMISMDKDVADWTVRIDEKVGDGPWRVGDWVAGSTPSKSMNELAAMDKLFRTQSGEIKAYHGTSYKNWLEIKERGFRVNPNKYDYADKVKGISDKGVYVALSPSVARRYATRDAGGRKAALIEIVLRDWTRIRVDEDSMIAAFNRIQSNKKMRTNLAKVLEGDLNAKADRLKKMHDASWRRHEKFKRPKNTDKMFLHDALHEMLRAQERGRELSKREETVLNYLKNYAIYVAKGEMTFQYTKPERIPKSDIKLVETFTSKKVRKDYEDQDEKMAAMLDTIKLHDTPAGKPRAQTKPRRTPSASPLPSPQDVAPPGMEPLPEGTPIDRDRFLGMVKAALGDKPKSKDIVAAFGISPPTLRGILNTGKVGRNSSTKIVRGWNKLVSAA